MVLVGVVLLSFRCSQHICIFILLLSIVTDTLLNKNCLIFAYFSAVMLLWGWREQQYVTD